MNQNTLTLTHQSGKCFTPEIQALLVYLRLMIVSITLSKVLDVGSDLPSVGIKPAMLDAAGGGGGSAIPVVGIKPAKVEVDSAHMSATATANLFICVILLLWSFSKRCGDSCIKENGTE